MGTNDTGLTTWDVAKRLEVTPERVRQLHKTGKLPAMLTTPGGVRIFNSKVVEALRQERAAAREKRA